MISAQEQLNQIIFLSQIQATDQSYLEKLNQEKAQQLDLFIRQQESKQSLVKNYSFDQVSRNRYGAMPLTTNLPVQEYKSGFQPYHNQQGFKNQQIYHLPIMEAIVCYHQEYQQIRQQVYNQLKVSQQKRVESKQEKDHRFTNWYQNLQCSEKFLVPINETKEVWLRFDKLMGQQLFGPNYQ